ncbi:hypothetical protein A3742_08270 [Oleiphilus sp. HI0071]|nr:MULTISPECIES: hypothetical protein [unclassified Oleiphilus]KZY72558.1 hypothetical protein A3737_10625 [Oleiphilus sp. HI0065]KZY82863.1 hypothetical protein A3742_08270 [Oleiphilus sp. HI0071]KZZ04825.1 hypothetical protein A3744_09100 [Oleiphilus sp. HI0073]KZZ41189.1 hypothetical protein A3758_23535 [Oleiphilus sp. HI0118]KZZ49169.1 hypothetical protein A3760_02975 [Oleiphilus sp. HI0122]KZZ80261.1 hypothetical protein A3767_00825 [Oleiphilus sp. HI0133]
MYVMFLILIWLTPAFIAGALGWSGIWGSGSAFFEYLIPLPVAGGVLHVPGLIVSMIVMKVLNGDGEALTRKTLFSFGAVGVFAFALALHIDFDRLYSAMFTDYSPSGSAVRFDSNALYLFILTDAFWVSVYAFCRGVSLSRKHVFIFCAVLFGALFVKAIGKGFSGPSFEIGGSTNGPNRGQELQVVFTNAQYDEAVFRNWLAERPYLIQPWTNPNTQHESLVFTNSMQILKWGKYEDLNDSNIVATVCAYEEDKSLAFYKGAFDCFEGRQTVSMRIQKIAEQNPTGFVPWVDHWVATSILCENTEIPDERYVRDRALYNLCLNQKEDFKRDLKRFVESFGEDSDEVKLIRERAARF